MSSSPSLTGSFRGWCAFAAVWLLAAADVLHPYSLASSPTVKVSLRRLNSAISFAAFRWKTARAAWQARSKAARRSEAAIWSLQPHSKCHLDELGRTLDVVVCEDRGSRLGLPERGSGHGVAFRAAAQRQDLVEAEPRGETRRTASSQTSCEHRIKCHVRTTWTDKYVRGPSGIFQAAVQASEQVAMSLLAEPDACREPGHPDPERHYLPPNSGTDKPEPANLLSFISFLPAKS